MKGVFEVNFRLIEAVDNYNLKHYFTREPYKTNISEAFITDVYVDRGEYFFTIVDDIKKYFIEINLLQYRDPEYRFAVDTAFSNIFINIINSYYGPLSVTAELSIALIELGFNVQYTQNDVFVFDVDIRAAARSLGTANYHHRRDFVKGLLDVATI